MKRFINPAAFPATMEGTFQREPDELWTSYLRRRLEGVGLHFEPDVTGHAVSVMAYTTDDSDVSIYRIVRECSNEDLERLLEQRHYAGAHKILDALLVDGFSISLPGEEGFFMFDFSPDWNSVFSWEDMPSEDIPERFRKYAFSDEDDRKYSAEEAIDDIVAYVLELKPESGFPVPKSPREEPEQQSRRDEAIQEGEPAPDALREERNKPDDLRLEEILRTVRSLHALASGRAAVLQDEDAYLGELYVRTINDDVNSLQILEHEGRRIPYVLVHSSQIEGNVGKPSNNLYFVARDKAPEVWQQSIVALHESMCVKGGHEGHQNARKMELAFAQQLGREKEYLAWRGDVDNGELCAGADRNGDE